MFLSCVQSEEVPCGGQSSERVERTRPCRTTASADVCLLLADNERERVCVCARERERKRECVCERERERVCVCVRKRERLCVCVCVCVRE